MAKASCVASVKRLMHGSAMVSPLLLGLGCKRISQSCQIEYCTVQDKRKLGEIGGSRNLLLKHVIFGLVSTLYAPTRASVLSSHTDSIF